jgi:AraC-like DNA-binding protein
MRYQTYPPAANLAGLIDCYWTLEDAPDNVATKQTIVPDGRMEMIFHLGDPYRQYLPDGTSLIQPRSFVIGQLTRPLTIEPTGMTNIFSVRFQHEGFLPWSTRPLKDLENRAVALEELFGENGLTLEQQINAAPATGQRIALIEEFLSERIASIDKIVGMAVDTILGTNGQISVKDICTPLPIDRRQLERRFSASVGLSPKQLGKIIRLQSVTKKILDGNFSSFTELAYEGDYYDQAHFIRDFKEFTGYTPGEFYGDNFRMSALFYGTPGE